MNRLRYTPLPCDDCHQLTTLLKRLKKKAYMNRLQLAEEKVGSVIYDVWYCNHCNHTKNIGYESMHSNVTPCPSCHNKTYRPTRTQVVKRATRYAEGEGIQYYECAYCNHTVKSPYTIAKLSSPSSTSSFLGSGSSGSSGGSSSSGSWGGGSSGGGGAGSSW